MFCRNMDWLFQHRHIWCEDDRVFFNHLCGYTSAVLLFLFSSLQKWRKMEFAQTIFNLTSYNARLRFLPIIWDYRHGTRWKSDDLPGCALQMKWAVNKRPHLSESFKIASAILQITAQCFCVPQPIWLFFFVVFFFYFPVSRTFPKSYEWIPHETLVENVIWHRCVFGGFKISHWMAPASNTVI